MKQSKDQLEAVYTFIEKYFYFIVGLIVFTLISLTVSLYAQHPQKIKQNEELGLVEKEAHFVNFTVERNGSEAHISWEASNNLQGNLKFALQKSTNGVDFNSIFVKEFTTINKSEIFTYTDIENSDTYYRLCEINMETNNKHYSNISWATVAKRYRLEARSAKPNLAYHQKE
jgi:hypothetical protein